MQNENGTMWCAGGMLPCLEHMLHDTDVVRFVQEASCSYEPREKFFERGDIPAGLDPACAWELVSFVRCVNGRPTVRARMSADGELHTRAFWTETPAVHATMADVVARSDAASPLWTALRGRMRRSEVAQLLVEELTAACYRDGVDVGYEAVRGLVMERRPPEDASEKLAARAACLFYGLVSAADEAPRIDADFMRTTYARLTTEVGTVCTTPYAPVHPPKRENAARTGPELLGGIVESYSDELLWGTSPVYNVLLNADIIWDARPFDRFNGLMELLVRAAAFRRYGIPVLCLVPLSKMRLDWERDLLDPSVVPFRWGSAVVESSYGTDSTPYLECMVGFLQEGVGRIERLVERIVRREAACKVRVERDGRLNHRQCDLLSAMVDDPELEIDVHGYQERYGVVTSTARTDLNRLVALRLLLDEFRGRRQVFWVRPDMVDNLVEG